MSNTYLPGNMRQRIQDLIKDREITQADLASAIGLSKSTLSRYLSEKLKSLGDGYVIRIAKYFNVSTDFILGETDIPDRKNYDIEELGLSAKSAKLLYTGKIDSEVLNQLIENRHFPKLIKMIKKRKIEIVKTGMEVYNQQFDFLNSLLMHQAANCPEDADAAKQAVQCIEDFKKKPFNADMEEIRMTFMQIVKEISYKSDSSTNNDTIKLNSEVLDQIRNDMTKGEHPVDLKKYTPDEIASVVTHIFAVNTGLPENTMQGLHDLCVNLINQKQEQSHDK